MYAYEYIGYVYKIIQESNTIFNNKLTNHIILHS